MNERMSGISVRRRHATFGSLGHIRATGKRAGTSALTWRSSSTMASPMRALVLLALLAPTAAARPRHFSPDYPWAAALPG